MNIIFIDDDGKVDYEQYGKILNQLYGKIKECKRKDKEIERLNYGIKELDDMFYETFRISQNGYYSISEWELKEFTDKLRELKGSDKE